MDICMGKYKDAGESVPINVVSVRHIRNLLCHQAFPFAQGRDEYTNIYGQMCTVTLPGEQGGGSAVVILGVDGKGEVLKKEKFERKREVGN
jgi:hypothetical protein